MGGSFCVLSSCSYFGGGPVFLSGRIGQEAVNAFMLASGFLIYFQASISKSYEGMTTFNGVKNFYIRRYFRIAPAYYVALIVTLFVAGYLGEAREGIAQILPHTMTSMERYYIEQPIKNLFFHLSFVFGLLPEYAFSTPLPDWSLGLEMQFYLIFPVLFIFLRKHFLIFIILSILVMQAILRISYHFDIHYPMPSFLPIKFHNFAAGMILAHLLLEGKNYSRIYSIFLVLITALIAYKLNRTLHISILFLFSWWWVCVPHNENNRLIKTIAAIFRHNSSKFLADISYSIYIFHLIFMLPFFAVALSNGKLDNSEWMISTTGLFVGVAIIAFFVYRFIELKGIHFGKSLEKRTQ
ncbi:acyltransferase family protein [Methylophaga sulfidovorans]|uniref:Peptidoglycan/LPS O-acetylase OafA/YrhL, contains acyltransferase and SGNH-hydrolase domains n=1 Tax=Methylophaga sulfidovorans TaxID=45496 RepID=A0A1I4B418_9GAMM|nr:acyltransferase [Methylophaga sulfidovorans]SFK62801.1 Peptidoglycan/LPS O-acetylase OafA/YrhL, contains acyltransferase and SGNH-hydrolase domains [Methylophaga sulfidovorans]